MRSRVRAPPPLLEVPRAAARRTPVGLRTNDREESAVASKSQDVRPKITLACEVCKERNYITKKNRRNTPDRLELKKYCPRCNTNTGHRETR